MPNTYFQFRQFIVHQSACAMKVTTDSCLFGAWVAAELQQPDSSTSQALDIGTGTGLLSLMAVQKNTIRIDAIEIDKSAASQARENIRLSPWKERINVVHEDLLKWEPQKKYDVIIANPPFYEGDLPALDSGKNVAHHQGGLRLRELIQFIKTYLADNGRFFLLLPYKRFEEVKKSAADHALSLQKVVRVKQTPQHLPFRVMVSGAKFQNAGAADTEFIIKDGNHYSTAFTALLKDYYLHL